MNICNFCRYKVKDKKSCSHPLNSNFRVIPVGIVVFRCDFFTALDKPADVTLSYQNKFFLKYDYAKRIGVRKKVIKL